MKKRQERDQKYLETLEEITRTLNLCEEKFALMEQNNPQAKRLKLLKNKLTSERRLLEDISLPCRLILEHFSIFMGKPDHTIGFRLGMLEVGRGILNDFTIEEWGNIYIVIGNIRLGWRDKDYQYLFYPDKVILRSYDPSKPEIHFFFNFAFKYSKVLPEFTDIVEDEQTFYIHPDFFESLED